MAFTKVTNTGIGSTGTVLLQNLNVTGIVTAGFGVSTVDVFTTGITSFANTTDSTSSTTGSVIVSGGVGIAGSLNVGGSVSVGGTLTYEDVTNVDSVGIITARSGIKVGSGITLSPDGDSFATGVTTVGSKIDVTNDTHGNLNAVLARGADPTFQLQSRNDQHSNDPQSGIGTFGAFYSDNEIVALSFMRGSGQQGAGSLGIIQAGEEKIRIDSNGYLGIGTASVNTPLHVHHSTVNGVALFESGDVYCSLVFQDSNSNDSDKPQFGVQGDDFRWVTHDGSSSAERMRIKSSGELIINQSSLNTYVDGAGYSQTPLLQVVSNDNISTMMSLRYNSGAGAANRRATFAFARTADGTSVSDNSVLGEVLFMGEGNSAILKGASVRAEVDGAPGASDMPGRLVFSTTADGSASLTERARITSNGKILIGSDTIRNIGGAAASGHLQIEGTTGNTSSLSLINNQNNANMAVIRIAKTRGTSDGAVTTVANGDSLGGITFTGADGTDLLNTTAQIRAIVNGTVAGNTIPTDILFETSATNGSSLSERARIGSNGLLTVTATGQSSGIRLIDGSNSGGAPNLEIIGKRSDSNVNTAFSSNIFLGSNRTDQKVTDSKFLGTINFGGNHTDGTIGNISYAAAIAARASGDFNSKSDMPTDLIFTTGTSGTDRDGEAAGQSNVGTERLRIHSNGDISVGTNSNIGKFLIKSAGNGSGNSAFRVENSDGTYLFILRNDGLFQTGNDNNSPYNITGSTGANVFIHASSKSLRRSTSSIRYKKDIADATWGLAEVLKLRPVTFKSNGTGDMADDQTYGGFTAEDIHDLGLTEFVQYNENNEPDALSYGHMVALLTNAIKELNAKIVALGG